MTDDQHDDTTHESRTTVDRSGESGRADRPGEDGPSGEDGPPGDEATASTLAARLEERAVPLETTDPDSDLADLRPLEPLFEDVTVLGMGEATHGTREFFRLKHRLFEFLAEELDFRLFGLEANFAEVRAIDAYVRRGDGDPGTALDGLSIWPWKTEEVLALVEWSRAFNEDRPPDDRIGFYGFDAQFPAAQAEALVAYLDAADPVALDDHRDTLTTLAEEGLDAENEDIDVDEGTLLDERLGAAERLIAALGERFERRADEYAAATSDREYELARRDLRTLERAVAAERAKQQRGLEARVEVRDRSMAENVAWILDHASHDRVALWAHTEHVRRDVRTADWGRAEAMGSHLARRFGDSYYALGFDFRRGRFQALVERDDYELRACSLGAPPDGSATELFAAVEEPLYFLDLGGAVADPRLADWFDESRQLRSVGAVYYGDDPDSHHDAYSLPGSLDGVLFVEETGRAVPLDSV